MTVRFIARDGMGVPRVWGEGPTAEIAETRCMDAVVDYCQERRDKRVSEFRIEREHR